MDKVREIVAEILNFIEDYIKVPVKFIGTGAGREAMIVRL